MKNGIGGFPRNPEQLSLRKIPSENPRIYLPQLLSNKQ